MASNSFLFRKLLHSFRLVRQHVNAGVPFQMMTPIVWQRLKSSQSGAAAWQWSHLIGWVSAITVTIGNHPTHGKCPWTFQIFGHFPWKFPLERRFLLVWTNRLSTARHSI